MFQKIHLKPLNNRKFIRLKIGRKFISLIELVPVSGVHPQQKIPLYIFPPSRGWHGLQSSKIIRLTGLRSGHRLPVGPVKIKTRSRSQPVRHFIVTVKDEEIGRASWRERS